MNNTILSQIISIRDSGLVNMFDAAAVQRIAYDNNMFELVLYIDENLSQYFHFIAFGKESDAFA